MINELLKEIKELRDEMIQANWPAQRLSDIITRYEIKLQDQKTFHQKVNSQCLIQ